MCIITFHQTLTWMMLDYERAPNCKHISMNFHEDNVVSCCIILLQSHVLINI
jgi:hypothetical protein